MSETSNQIPPIFYVAEKVYRKQEEELVVKLFFNPDLEPNKTKTSPHRTSYNLVKPTFHSF